MKGCKGLRRALGGFVLGLFCFCCDKDGASSGDSSKSSDTIAPDGGGDTDTGAHTPATLAVRIDFMDADETPSYLVTGVFEDGRVLRAHCGKDSDADPGISCEESGAIIAEVTGPIHLTVKAPGYDFVSEAVSPSALVVEDAMRIYSTDLSLLPAFETNDAYRTGYTPDEMDAFTQMAYTSTSEMGAVASVKFVITDFKTDPHVYFMNMKKHLIHYDFVRDVLELNMSSSEFWEAAYAAEDRNIVAGTVMYYDTVDSECERLGHPIVSPFALTFFPSDSLSVEQARKVYRLIEERLGFSPFIGDSHRFYYLPAGAQQEAALSDNLALFNQWDAGWVFRREIYRQKSWQIMNTGVAFGTLRLADATALEGEAFSFKDIVVLPTLPIQLPIVGGTLTEEFQTPLCHVNVMSRNRGTPNMSLAGAASKPEVSDLFGKLVRYEVTDESYSLEETTLEEAEAFWASLSKEPIDLESDTAYSELPLFDEIGFDDWMRVGAKAANLAELHQLLGEQAPRGFAVPFYYYQQTMENGTVDTTACRAACADCLLANRPDTVCAAAESLCMAAAGESLKTFVDTLLETDSFNLDTPLREATLAVLRHLITNGTTDPAFAEALDAQVEAVFGSDKVRLRSSTNTEDIPGFSGAGLYDSKAAYAEGEERASVEIREIWASVWNWRAFEERSFWNIDHRSTRMGVAVNQAFSDEAANGVLITQNISDIVLEGMYVNVQLGETSVTNPEGTFSPEIFAIIRGTEPGTVQASRLGYSSLSPDEPIMTDEEISVLYTSAMKVQNHFATLYDENPYMLALDLEFKLLGEDRTLMIKQARPYAY